MRMAHHTRHGIRDPAFATGLPAGFGGASGTRDRGFGARQRQARGGEARDRRPDVRIAARLLLSAAVAAFGVSLQAAAAAAQPAAVTGKPGPLAHTFSIVARDPATGEMGVAVQSHWFSVGSIVTWAEAGVGAVATQSFVDPAYGYKGLELMRTGVPAPGGAEAAARRRRRSAKSGRWR